MSGSAYPPGPAPGWYRDPFGQADGRYWNGSMWTDAVSRGGVTLKVAPDPTQATIPPVPGSELRAPQAIGADPAPAPPKSSALPVVLAVVLVLAALAIGFLILRSGDDDSPSTTTPTTATDAPVTTPSVTSPPVTTPPVTTPPVTEPPATTVAP